MALLWILLLLGGALAYDSSDYETLPGYPTSNEFFETVTTLNATTSSTTRDDDDDLTNTVPLMTTMIVLFSVMVLLFACAVGAFVLTCLRRRKKTKEHPYSDVNMEELEGERDY